MTAVTHAASALAGIHTATNGQTKRNRVRHGESETKAVDACQRVVPAVTSKHSCRESAKRLQWQVVSVETYHIATFDFVRTCVYDRCQMKVTASARGGQEQTGTVRTSAKEDFRCAKGGFRDGQYMQSDGSRFTSPNCVIVSSRGPALGHCVHARSASREPGQITNVSAPRCQRGPLQLPWVDGAHKGAGGSNTCTRANHPRGGGALVLTSPPVPAAAAGGVSPAEGVPMPASKMSLLRSFVQDAPPPPLERAAGVHGGNS